MTKEEWLEVNKTKLADSYAFVDLGLLNLVSDFIFDYVDAPTIKFGNIIVYMEESFRFNSFEEVFNKLSVKSSNGTKIFLYELTYHPAIVQTSKLNEEFQKYDILPTLSEPMYHLRYGVI